MTDPETLAQIAERLAEIAWDDPGRISAEVLQALQRAEAQGEAKGRTRIEELERALKDQLNEYIEVAHGRTISTLAQLADELERRADEEGK